MTNPKIVAELTRIADRNGGILRAEDVVEAARNERSPLHPYFDWDDSEAAQKWRLHQARQLIKVTVTYIEDGKNRMPMRVFVSLTPDRKEDGGGYRPMVTVLSDAAQRKQLLEDAMRELKTFEEKYRGLQELTSVFDAIRKTRKKLSGVAA